MQLVTGGLIDIEISDIISNSNDTTNNIEYYVIIHTPTRDITIDYYQTIELMREYNSNLGDYLIVNFRMYGGDYILDVHPAKDNLELSIKQINTKTNTELFSKRYKLLILNNEGNIEGSVFTKMSRVELNSGPMFHIEGQCIEREMQGLLAAYYGVNFINTTVKDAMYSILAMAARIITIENIELTLNIDIVEPNQQVSIGSITVPTGVRAVEFPSWLQNGNVGVYNGAIGTYYQKYEDNATIFVYPLYDTEAYDNRDCKKLAIYFANTAKLDTIENTYYVDGDVIKILAGSNTTSEDKGANMLHSTGETIISSNSLKVIDGNFQVTDDEVQYDKTEQLSGVSIIDQRDGLKKAIYVGNESNLYKYRSAVLKNTLATYQVTWHFANVDLLHPGMPVQFIYEDNDNGMIKLNGTLQSVYSRYSKENPVTSALLIIMVESPSAYLKNDKTSSE